MRLEVGIGEVAGWGIRVYNILKARGESEDLSRLGVFSVSC